MIPNFVKKRKQLVNTKGIVLLKKTFGDQCLIPKNLRVI